MLDRNATRQVRASLAAAFALLLGANLQAAGAPEKTPRKARVEAHWLDPDKTEPARTRYCTFRSKTIGQDVSYHLYLPPDYEAQSDRRYPVIYWLHGLGGTQQTGARFVVPHLDAAVREGVMPPVIAVMVNGMVSSFYNDSPDGKLPVESVIIRDLIPHIDATYRTVAKREGRAVQGYSMGGWGAAHLGFKHPDLFGVVCIDAGALLDADAIRQHQTGIVERMFGNDMEYFAANHPRTLVEKNADRVRGRTFVRIGVGANDNLLKVNEQYHILLDQLRIAHEYEVVPDVAHMARVYYAKLGAKGFAFYNKALVLGMTTASAQAAGSPPAAVFPGVQWREASPESQGMNSEKLRAAVAYMDTHFGADGAKELIVIRNGCLIWKGPNVDAYHNIWSATKTFTATVLGLLIADGKCTLDDLAVKHLPGLADRYPAYSKIRLRHLASMSSGYKGELVDVTPNEQPWGDPMRYLTPTAPLFEPGTRVQYHDHQVFVLGEILTQLAGEPMKAMFKRRIAEPIGLTRCDWGVSGKIAGIELNNAAGTPSKVPGVQITAREMARFGLLYLNRGNWNGKQILPASFVDEAGKNQVPGVGASNFLHGRYGLYWWTNDVMPSGKRPWPAAPPKTYTAHGHGCNFCFIIPEWNMVVVRMGTTPIGKMPQQDTMWSAFFAILAEALDVASSRVPPLPPE